MRTEELKQKANEYGEMTIILVPDKEQGGYTIISKDFPEVISEGDDMKDAINNLATGINVMHEYLREKELLHPTEADAQQRYEKAKKYYYANTFIEDADDLAEESMKIAAGLKEEGGE